MNRRGFLATAAGAAGALALGAARRGFASGTPLDRIGLQLYTVRSLMAADMERTLAAVAGIGYREVEFAGYFGRSPAEIRRILDAEGLAAPSAHLPVSAFRDDLDATLEAASVVGHAYLVLPWIDAAEREDLDGYRRVAEQMNRIGERCRAAGVRFGYHNHDFEFSPLEGTVPYHVLLAETDPELVAMEADLYWMVNGGVDPLACFEAHPGRFELVHVKDRTPDGRMVDVGAGAINFAAIFRRAGLAGIRHAFVEHDAPADPEASIRASHEALVALRAEIA